MDNIDSDRIEAVKAELALAEIALTESRAAADAALKLDSTPDNERLKANSLAVWDANKAVVDGVIVALDIAIDVPLMADYARKHGTLAHDWLAECTEVRRAAFRELHLSGRMIVKNTDQAGHSVEMS